ncbi:ABC transporter substrate-binding protein [Piscinibacter terrae]|uniref:ABC transporter substrate-binding protein n=1 Tax=Piscinibacter terrae TaxID=2496871 RepID=UPI001386F0F3|nr:extracellular solute-binding protein [Albitalea terrae]
MLTSFPSEVVSVYKKAYEASAPGVDVEVVSKSSSDLVATLKKMPTGQRPDVVWASDPGAFAAMAHQGLLSPAAELRNTSIPTRIGSFPMNGPDNLYFGQALSGYGLMWNRDYLRQNGLRTPFSWADLARPVYFNHVAMSSPLRSGTTHLTVDVILQAEGWDAGWTQLLFIAANCAAISPKSGDVPTLVKEGKSGVGLVVDFFGLSAKASGAPVTFAYPERTAVLPASIAMVAGSKAPREGERFIKFALSTPGQELLFEKAISRMPASPYAAASLKVPSDFPNVYAVARKTPVKFDLALYEERRELVAALFERTITRAHAELRQAVDALIKAERIQEKAPTAENAERIRQARELIGKPVVPFADYATQRKRDDLALAGTEAVAHPWTVLAKLNYAQATLLVSSVGKSKPSDR